MFWINIDVIWISKRGLKVAEIVTVDISFPHIMIYMEKFLR